MATLTHEDGTYETIPDYDYVAAESGMMYSPVDSFGPPGVSPGFYEGSDGALHAGQPSDKASTFQQEQADVLGLAREMKEKGLARTAALISLGNYGGWIAQQGLELAGKAGGAAFKGARWLTHRATQYGPTVERLTFNAIDNWFGDGKRQNETYRDYDIDADSGWITREFLGDMRKHEAGNELFTNFVASLVAAGGASAAMGAVAKTQAAAGLMAKSPFWRQALMGSSAKWATTRGILAAGESATYGAAKLAGTQVAGRITGMVAQDLAADVLTSPLWLGQKAEEDLRYEFDTGLLAQNVGLNILFNSVIGSIGSYNAYRKAGVEASKDLFATAGEAVPATMSQALKELDNTSTVPLSQSSTQSIVATNRIYRATSLTDRPAAAGGVEVAKVQSYLDNMHGEAKEILTGKLQKKLRVDKISDAGLNVLSDWLDEFNISRTTWTVNRGGSRIPVNRVEAFNPLTGDWIGQDQTRKMIMQGLTANGLEGVNAAMEGYIPVRFSALKTNEDAVETAIKYQQARLRSVIGDSTALSSIASEMPELSGSLTAEMGQALGALEASGGKTSGSWASFLLPYDMANKTDPVVSAFIRRGKQVNKQGFKVQKVVADKMPTVLKYQTMDDAVRRPVYEKFSDFYSAINNYGWDVEALDELNGVVRARLKHTPGNEERWYQLTERAGLTGHYGGLPEMPNYVPSLKDLSSPASIEAASDAYKIFDEFQSVSKEIAAMDRLTHVFDGTPFSSRAVYTVTPSADATQFYRVSNTRTGEYYTFRTKKDAEVQLAKVIGGGAGEDAASWRLWEPEVRRATELATGAEDVRLKEWLWRRSGTKLGHWQGDLALSPTKEGMQEIIDAHFQMASASYRRSVISAYGEVWNRLDMMGKHSLAESLKKNIVGKVDANPVFDGLDKVANLLNDTIKDLRTPLGDSGLTAKQVQDVFYAEPPQVQQTVQKILGRGSGVLSRLYYSAGNLSAALVNTASIFQSIPLASQWYKQGALETAEAYTARTGLQAGDLPYKSSWGWVKKHAQRLVNDVKWNDAVDEQIALRGIASSEVKALNDLQYGKVRGKAGKVFDWFSFPTEKTEALSRAWTYKAGVTYGEEVLGLTPAQAYDFAENFLDVGMGTFSPLGQTATKQSMIGRQAMMFTTFVHNLVYRNLDMIADGRRRDALAASIVPMLLTGKEAMPFLDMYTAAHGLEDKSIQDDMWDAGIAGMGGIYIGDRFGAGFDDLYSGFANPAAVRMVGDAYQLSKEIISDIYHQGGSTKRLLLEEMESRGMGPLMRRGAAAALGYRTTASGNLKTTMAWRELARGDVEAAILDELSLLSGIRTIQHRRVERTDRMMRKEEEAKTRAKKVLNRLYKQYGREIGSGIEANLPKTIKNVNQLVRYYGLDLDTAVGAINSAVVQGSMTPDELMSEKLMHELGPMQQWYIRSYLGGYPQE